MKKAGVLDQESGTVVFNPQKGIYKTDGYSVSGDPLTLTQVTGKTVYSNTESTLTLGEFTFQAAYGKLQNGIATYLSAITVVGSCGYQIWFSRQ